MFCHSAGAKEVGNVVAEASAPATAAPLIK